MKQIVIVPMLIFLHMFGGKADYDVTPEWLEYIEKLKILDEEFALEESRASRAVGTTYFNITFTSTPQPITVHSLRPEDIDVIAALGDSISAGTGIDAETFAGIAIQFRGLTWTAGGDEELKSSISIPNILRKFNPAVKGYSVGNKADFNLKEQDWFNVAVPGARAKDMTDQTLNLIERLKADNRTSFENDWKLISIFIGGNDLCALGRDPVGASPETYRDEIQEALDIMHDQIPRALVQIVQIMEIYLLPEVPTGFGADRFCTEAQSLVCSHVVDSVQNETMLAELRSINWEYQQLVVDLVYGGRYNTRDDFTVVVQPFFKNTVLPMTEDGQVDATYFAPDCFHFSSKGHAMGALNVWNNMLEPEDGKTTEWDLTDLSCPTEEHPYIFTHENSGGKMKAKSNKMDKSEVTCAKIVCKTTPDWAIGLLCALAAVMALQLLMIFCALKNPGKDDHSKKTSSSSSFNNYAL